MTETTGIDSCPAHPTTVVIAGNTKRGKDESEARGGVAVSLDAGKSFTRADGYQPKWGQARVAMDAKVPLHFVVATAKGNIRWTVDGGKTFGEANHSPPAWDYGVRTLVFKYCHPLCADRIKPKHVYIFGKETGRLY